MGQSAEDKQQFKLFEKQLNQERNNVMKANYATRSLLNSQLVGKDNKKSELSQQLT